MYITPSFMYVCIYLCIYVVSDTCLLITSSSIGTETIVGFGLLKYR